MFFFPIVVHVKNPIDDLAIDRKQIVSINRVNESAEFERQLAGAIKDRLKRWESRGDSR